MDDGRCPAGPAGRPPALFISGWLRQAPAGSTPVEVRRAMTVLGRDGVALGSVAAVVADPATRAVTDLVLGGCPPGQEYRLIPQALIEQVAEAVVQVRLSRAEVAQLPCHTPA